MRLSNDVIDDFKANYVPSDNIGTAFLVLLALHKEDYEFLDKLDDSNKDRKMILLYRDLVYKGYLTENDEKSKVHFSLTPKSIELIESLNDDKGLDDNGVVVVKSKQTEFFLESNEPSDDDTVKSWIRDWLKLWPTKRADGTVIRSGTNVCTNKMTIFLKNNPRFDKSIVYKATKLYLEGEAERGWVYTHVASNFISKAESGRSLIKDSKLEAYCDIVISGDYKEKEKYSSLQDDSPFV